MFSQLLQNSVHTGATHTRLCKFQPSHQNIKSWLCTYLQTTDMLSLHVSNYINIYAIHGDNGGVRSKQDGLPSERLPHRHFASSLWQQNWEIFHAKIGYF